MTIVDPLFEPEVVEDPHGYYAQLRATDPVHELPGRERSWSPAWTSSTRWSRSRRCTRA